jgi:outer membrane protein TolC
MKTLGLSFFILVALFGAFSGRAVAAEPSAQDEPGQGAAPQSLPSPASLADCLAWAEAHNPGLQQAYLEWQAVIDRPVDMSDHDLGSHSHSVATPQTINADQVKDASESSDRKAGWVFNWIGMLGLKSSLNDLEVDVARQRYEAERLKLRSEVINLYCEYNFLRCSTELVREKHKLLKSIRDDGLIQCEAGATQSVELLKTQMELERLGNQLEILIDQGAPFLAKLNAVLDRPADASLELPREIVEEKPDISEAELLAWLRENGPEIRNAVQDVERERLGVEMAKQDCKPWLSDKDSRVAPATVSDQPSTLRGLDAAGIAATVGVQEALARLNAAEHMLADRQNRLAADVKSAVQRIREAQRNLKLNRDKLLPLATQCLELMKAQHAVNCNASFAEILRAEKEIVDMRMDKERALADVLERIGELEALVGKPLPRFTKDVAVTSATQP